MIDDRRDVGSPSRCGTALALVAVAIVLAALLGDPPAPASPPRTPTLTCGAKPGQQRCRPPASAQMRHERRSDAGDDSGVAAVDVIAPLLLLLIAAVLAAAARTHEWTSSVETAGAGQTLAVLPTCAFPLGTVERNAASTSRTAWPNPCGTRVELLAR
jgi:hypothetical protein